MPQQCKMQLSATWLSQAPIAPACQHIPASEVSERSALVPAVLLMRSVGLQLGFLMVAYPSLGITYLGQAAYLMVNPDNYATTFYSCIPSPVYWPVFVVAVLAAIVASQV